MTAYFLNRIDNSTMTLEDVEKIEIKEVGKINRDMIYDIDQAFRSDRKIVLCSREWDLLWVETRR